MWMEVLMAESRREGTQTAKESERSGETSSTSQTAVQQTERFTELGREGIRRAADASGAMAGSAARSGTAVADCAQEITAAWARYAEEVMRHTSEASRAMLSARTFSEMLEVQAKLLRDNMQAFLDQSVKIAESTSRMATRPFEALKEASSETTRR
jgi:hypothetical protein